MTLALQLVCELWELCALRMLRIGTEAQRRKEVRKLHLLWWHAGRTAMERIFRAAVAPEYVIRMIPEVIHTCRECRVWAAPGPAVTPSIELPLKQNEDVERAIISTNLI